ncbi:hypothetical protein F503_03820 [Ophiostoma piceae UAMH 11346]|uniref:Uncharacterized protein n=1 Tax=Ophiostoma piceae (strain UAMH 11346) TaxID=1262450 RepID=S3CWQ1_OPHP1|nr:hypothetical protein F503_03820 [Ophiostoma piceae UAMH 11346]
MPSASRQPARQPAAPVAKDCSCLAIMRQFGPPPPGYIDVCFRHAIKGFVAASRRYNRPLEKKRESAMMASAVSRFAYGYPLEVSDATIQSNDPYNEVVNGYVTNKASYRDKDRSGILSVPTSVVVKQLYESIRRLNNGKHDVTSSAILRRPYPNAIGPYQHSQEQMGPQALPQLQAMPAVEPQQLLQGAPVAVGHYQIPPMMRHNMPIGVPPPPAAPMLQGLFQQQPHNYHPVVPDQNLPVNPGQQFAGGLLDAAGEYGIPNANVPPGIIADNNMPMDINNDINIPIDVDAAINIILGIDNDANMPMDIDNDINSFASDAELPMESLNLSITDRESSTEDPAISADDGLGDQDTSLLNASNPDPGPMLTDASVDAPVTPLDEPVATAGPVYFQNPSMRECYSEYASTSTAAHASGSTSSGSSMRQNASIRTTESEPPSLDRVNQDLDGMDFSSFNADPRVQDQDTSSMDLELYNALNLDIGNYFADVDMSL